MAADAQQISLTTLGPGDHVCGLFDHASEREELVARYLHDGILKGEKVVYIADAKLADPVVARLQAAGADIPTLRASGQFEVVGTRDVYRRDGRFDPDAMLATLDAQEAAMDAAGYPSLRITGDMSWALDGEEGLDALVEYESKLSRRIQSSRFHGICQYDTSLFPPAVQLGLLATHPLALINQDLYANFYYVPAEEFLGPGRDGAMLERWRRNLQEHRTLEEARRQSAMADLQRERERALSLFKSRFIRRAGEELVRPLGPLLEHLESLQDASLPETALGHADAALQEARRLSRVAQDIVGIVAADAGELRLKPTTVDLAAVASQAAHEAAATAREQGVDVQLVGSRALAWGDIAHLRTVVSDLLHLAIRRAGRNGQVRLVCGVLGASQARLLVMHDGKPFSDEETTQLFLPLGSAGYAHDNMYIARNIVELHGGRMHVSGTGVGSSTLEIILPARPLQAYA